MTTDDSLNRRQLESALNRFFDSNALEISRERDKYFPEGAAGSLTVQLHDALIGHNLDKFRIDQKMMHRRDEGIIRKLEKTRKTLSKLAKTGHKILPLMDEIHDLKREHLDLKNELLDQQSLYATLDNEEEPLKISGGGGGESGSDDGATNGGGGGGDNDDNANDLGACIIRDLPDVPVLSPNASELGPPQGILKKEKKKKVEFRDDRNVTKYYNLYRDEFEYKNTDEEEDWLSDPT